MSEDMKQEIMESERRIKTYINDMLQQQQPQAPSATQRKLNLDSIPALSSPATAAKKVTSHSNTSLLQTPLPPINNSSATDDILDKEHPFTMSEKARIILQIINYNSYLHESCTTQNYALSRNTRRALA
jgi:polysaccharide deacetylase 2 family uncharacterized protein YibQ